MKIPQPDLLVPVGGARRMGVDERGDRRGAPVLYLHGTPDSRLARHPDDGIAARLAVRLVALDRPGIGGSDADPDATPSSVADDAVAVLDALGIETCGVLSWSAGAIFGLALAGRHPERVRRLVMAAPLVPADAYGDTSGAEVLRGADEARRMFASQVGDMDPGELGTELAPWLVPPVIDEPTAREMLADSLTQVAAVPGAAAALVRALAASVAAGTMGIERDIAAQATPLGTDLDRITAPVEVVSGTLDPVTPPAMARWIASRLGGSLDLVAGAAHALPILAWERLLSRAARP